MKQLTIALAVSAIAVAGAHASEWAGSSLSMQSTANGFVCRAGAVRLSIDGDTVNGSAGNGVNLAGRLSKNGSVSLEGGSGAKRVRFTGKKAGENIRGAWMEALTGCGGTWRAQMIAADSPAVQPAPQDGSDDASIFMEQPDEVQPEDGAGPGEDASPKTGSSQ